VAPGREASTGAAPAWAGVLSTTLLVALLIVLAWGAWNLFELLHKVPLATWGGLLGQAALTLARVLASTLIGTLWALPAGLAIGLSPRLSRWMQPVTQVAASFPAPMLFPLVIAALHASGVPLGAGSVLLMLLGTQWYILFNVVAGAMAIPEDMKEAARVLRLGRLDRWRYLLLPAIFPYLVTGLVTAAGGAWNASIVAEYFHFQGRHLSVLGLGSTIAQATDEGNFALLLGATMAMAFTVVTFNRLVWRRLYRLAAERFTLEAGG